MKDEEIDWLIYHLIAEAPAPAPVEDLIQRSGLDQSVVEHSLRRLEHSFLIVRRENMVQVLSVNEALLRCQAKYDSRFPFTIENGVVRPKRGCGP